MDKPFAISNDRKEYKLKECDFARSHEFEQNHREELLNNMIRAAIAISKKYLHLLRTNKEDSISDLLDDELMILISTKHLSYSRAANIIDIAGIMLNSLSDELRYKAKAH